MINKKILDRISDTLSERSDKLDELYDIQCNLATIKRTYETDATVPIVVNLINKSNNLFNIELPIHMLIEIMENKVNYLQDSVMLLNTELKELGYEVSEYDDASNKKEALDESK